MAPIPPPPADPSQLANYIPPPPDDPSQLGSDSPRDTSFVGQMFAPSQAPGQGLEINNISSPNWRKDLVTNEPVGFGGNMVRSLPSMVLGAASGFNPAGFAAGEGLRQGAVGINAAMGNTQAPSVLQAVGSPALAYGSAYASNLASPYLGKALIGGTLKSAAPSEMTRIPFSQANLPFQQTLTQNGPVGGALGAVGQGASNVARYTRENYAGVKAASSRFAEKFPDLVSKYIGSGPEVGDQLANDLRTSVSNASQQLEDTYKAGVTRLTNSKMPIRINLEDRLGAVFRNIAHEAGYMDPARNASSSEAGFYMKNILSRVNDMKAASPLDIYYFQKDLNRYITDNIGTSLGGDLLSTKDALRLFIEDHPQLTKIADMNSAWSNMKIVEGLSKNITNSNDLISNLQRVFDNPADTLKKRGVEQLSQLVPEVGDTLQKIQAYQAAKDLTPYQRSAPPTGFGASMLNTQTVLPSAAMYEFGAGNPLTGIGLLGLGGLRQALTSPRMAFGAMRAGQALGSTIGASVGKSVFPVATVAGQAATRGALTNYSVSPTTPQAMERFIRNSANPNKQ